MQDRSEYSASVVRAWRVRYAANLGRRVVTVSGTAGMWSVFGGLCMFVSWGGQQVDEARGSRGEGASSGQPAKNRRRRLG
jgi:hypothetical protein